MTLTVAPGALTTFRELDSDADWWAVRNLLVRTQPRTPVGWNWDVRHWDGQRFHRASAEEARRAQGPVGMWEADTEIVAAMHREGSDGAVFFELDPDYCHLQAQMLDWAEDHLATDGGGQRRLSLYLFDYDLTRRALVEERGYEMRESGGWTRLLRFGAWPIPDAPLAAPYRLATTSPQTAQADAERMAILLNAAFGRTKHSATEYLPFMAGSPSFSHDLNLVALAPDDSFAAHVGVNWEPINRLGIFEPVCTHPDHLRKGLARSLMLEGMRRLRALGALTAVVETGDMEPANALYRVCGFTEEYRGHDYERQLPSA
jgi:GNAT superfamily N-acetyltransferase